MVTLLAAVSTYVLLNPLAGSRRRTQVAYGVTLALLGLFNVMGLMLVLPHAVYAWWVGDRSARFRWAIAATGGLVVIAPFVLISFTQRGQVSWIERPHLYDARALVTMEFGSRIAPAVVILALILAIAAARFFGGSGELAEDHAADEPSPGPTPARAAIVLGAAWALVPPIVLFAVSQILPMWTIHYLLFSLPGLTLLLAALVPGLDRMSTFGTAIACTLSVLLVGALGVPDQITNRDPVSGHGEDLLGVANYVGEGKKPGDAVFYTPAELRMLTEVSPEHMASLADFSLASTPLQAANLEGIPLDVEDLPRVLLPFQRVWMIEGLYKHPEVPGMQTEAPALIAAEFHEVRKLTITDVQVTLYARNAAVKPAVRSATSHRPVQSNARRGKRR
jgi:mannosyltransferase